MGTLFSIDFEGRQYLITAAHVLPEGKIDKIELRHDGKWLPLLPVREVGRASDPSDLAVLAINQRLGSHPLKVAGDVFVGGTYCFLGFPFGIETNISGNAGYPVPLVKHAVLSGLIPSRNNSFSEVFYLDGINNRGFSGGPVVDTSNPSEQNVFAVISGYRYESQPVFDSHGRAQELYFRENTGIIIATNLLVAIDLIKANPIGFEL